MTGHACTMAEAIAPVRDGMRVGLGGILGRRRPLGSCRSLVEAGIRGLHVYSFLAGAETELLVAGGAVASVTSGYLDPDARAEATESARAAGRIDWHEVSEHMFVGGLLATGAGLPFWPTLGGVGSDVAERLALRTVRCPYTDRPVLAVPATPLDVALLHAPAATEQGALLAPPERKFLDDADVTLARAARWVVVTVDRIAGTDEATGGGGAVLAPFEVDAIVCVGPGRP